MKLSFHVCHVPHVDEIYTGANAHYEAFFVDIPDEYFPKELLDIIHKQKEKNDNYPKSYVSLIAPHLE